MHKVFTVSTVSIFVLALILAFSDGSALAGPESVQQQASKQQLFPEISTTTLKKRLDSAPSFVLVDARSMEEYVQGHIPGAISVPPENIRYITGFLPKDREMPVVFYCRGYG